MKKKKKSHLKESYRSKFEARIATSLKSRGIKFKYEEKAYPLHKPLNGFCCNCGSNDVARNSVYNPDWFIYIRSRLAFIVETKGRLTPENRKTLLTFKRTYPDVDIRMVFMRDNTLTKTSKTRYSEWAEKNGFPWAIGDIPDEWII